jgi:hypothetical protein
MAKKQKPETNRVWIELEKPVDDAHGEKIAELATRMLNRLSPEDKGYKFMWSEDRHMYMYGNTMGFMYLTDRGQWFNLDHLGREAE